MLLGSGGERSVCLWRCRLLSVPLGEQASERRWDCSGLGRVTRRCLGTKWYEKFGDTGPYKNFDFLYNLLVPEFFCNFS